MHNVGFLIFLHFTLITLIICLVLVQRSAESSILVASTHFSPGGANKLLVKITRTLVVVFMINCLFISYLKYGKGFKKNVNQPNVVAKTVASVPTD